MVISNKKDFACHAMNYIATGKHSGGCTMNEIYFGETIPREYAESIMMELTQRGFLINDNKIDGGFKLAKPWNDATSLEVIQLMNDLWCWASMMSGSHKKKAIHKKLGGNGATAPVELELGTVR